MTRVSGLSVPASLKAAFDRLMRPASPYTGAQSWVQTQPNILTPGSPDRRPLLTRRAWYTVDILASRYAKGLYGPALQAWRYALFEEIISGTFSPEYFIEATSLSASIWVYSIDTWPDDSNLTHCPLDPARRPSGEQAIEWLSAHEPPAFPTTGDAGGIGWDALTVSGRWRDVSLRNGVRRFTLPRGQSMSDDDPIWVTADVQVYAYASKSGGTEPALGASSWVQYSMFPSINNRSYPHFKNMSGSYSWAEPSMSRVRALPPAAMNWEATLNFRVVSDLRPLLRGRFTNAMTQLWIVSCLPWSGGVNCPLNDAGGATAADTVRVWMLKNA